MSTDTCRAIIATAEIAGRGVVILDFTRLYLNTMLKKILYALFPDRCARKLKEALYGLKQAGVQCTRICSDHIMSRNGRVRSDDDGCVFYSTNMIDN